MIQIKRYFLLTLILFGVVFFSTVASANNLNIFNFDVTSTDVSSNTMTFQFNLSQDNSWKTTLNHDAVWIFMKYSTDAGQTWKHASMAASGINPAGFSVNSNYELVVASDEKGFFFRRKDFGSGNIAVEGIKFVWDYGQDGLSDEQAAAANTISNVYGIEMIYVPEGGFYAGDGASSSDFRFKQGSSDDDPWYISSETAITVTNVLSDGFYYQSTGASGESATGSSFLISNSFPKGYKGFYLMKYELTEGQWIDYFNTLTVAQKLNRDITSSIEGGKGSDSVVDRNTISWDSSNPALTAKSERPSRSITFVSWPDVASYADWAGLRPITELEFEKAARGADISSVPDEYAWGTTSYNAPSASAIYPDNQDELGSEAIFDGTANVNRNALGWTSGDGRVGGEAEGQKGPLRVGIFAENTTGRVTSGAGYYGNMELSGNVAEPVVTVGKQEGRTYLGTHGDGKLSTVVGYEGNATNVDWPGINASNSSYGITGTKGIGYRGGDFQSSNIRDFQISSRAYAAKDPDSEGWDQRYDAAAGIYYGGRLGRTAP